MEDLIPSYAIIELSIRAALARQEIGQYFDHTIYDSSVVVKTNMGIIKLSKTLIFQQYRKPESITDRLLAEVTDSFRAY